MHANSQVSENIYKWVRRFPELKIEIEDIEDCAKYISELSNKYGNSCINLYKYHQSLAKSYYTK